MTRALSFIAAFGLCAAMADEPPTMTSVLEDATADDWKRVEQSSLLYLDFEQGRVVFELAPAFAPAHVANLRQLAADGYFDGLSIIRSQDNYVVQWGDPAAGTDEARWHGDAKDSLAPEFYRQLEGLDLRFIDSLDAYAESVGFVDGMPAGTDGERAWLAHCYGMLGAGRANEPDSGSGAELYVVTGHAPRHLDRNVTLLGRVLVGIEHLSSLPRGTGPLGFYEDPSQYVPIDRIRFGDQLPPSERMTLERLRTDTATFEQLVEARRHRAEDWFVDPADQIGLCNVPIPVRQGGE